MNHKSRKIFVVCGKTGSGKSYFVKTCLIPLFKRVVIFDLMAEYGEDDGSFDSFITLDDFDTFKEHLIENCDNQSIKIIVRLSSLAEYESAIELVHLCENMVLVIEEIHQFANPYAMSETLENIVRFGRHTSTSIVGVTQRISDVGPLFLNNSDHIICYNLTDKNDISRLESISYVGEKAVQVSHLPLHQNLIFSQQDFT